MANSTLHSAPGRIQRGPFFKAASFFKGTIMAAKAATLFLMRGLIYVMFLVAMSFALLIAGMIQALFLFIPKPSTEI